MRRTTTRKVTKIQYGQPGDVPLTFPQTQVVILSSTTFYVLFVSHFSFEHKNLLFQAEIEKRF